MPSCTRVNSPERKLPQAPNASIRVVSRGPPPLPPTVPSVTPVLVTSAREEGHGKDARTFDSEVIVRRLGGVRLPVEIRVQFTDGRVVYETWDGQYRWTRFRYPGARVRAADVDPFGKIAVDIDPGNNSWADNAPIAQRAASKWAMRWMFWLQNFLELHTLLG